MHAKETLKQSIFNDKSSKVASKTMCAYMHLWVTAYTDSACLAGRYTQILAVATENNSN
jgi:hypothetical protein